MHLIYGQSVLTIIALSGLDANAGLPGVRPNTRPLKYTPLGEDFALVANSQNLDLMMKNSHYETRGWTFQERILSRRCLFVSHWQYFFSCMKETSCEELIDSVELQKQDPYENCPGPEFLLRYLAAKNWDANANFFFYMYGILVEEFSRRSLTYPSDATNAFTGVNSVVSQYLGCLLAAGFPGAIMEFALLWLPKPGLNRKQSRNDYFPTWTWAGWNHPVIYRLATEIFLMQEECERCFSYRHDYESIDKGVGVRDILQINSFMISAECFTIGLGALIETELDYPAEILDSNSKFAGMLFDTEVPAAPRKSSCWFLPLFHLLRPFPGFEIDRTRLNLLHLTFPTVDPMSSRAAIEGEEHMLIMLVEEKGDRFERLGIGQISLSALRKSWKKERKSFILA
jgi:hypothetical protein